MPDTIMEKLAENPRIAGMLRDLEQADLERVQRRAEEDPKGHKLTKVFAGPLRWRYYQSRNGRGQTVRHCYATTPNVAGYYLVWREVINKTDGRGRRDRWRATAKRTDARNIARDRHREANA